MVFASVLCSRDFVSYNLFRRLVFDQKRAKRRVSQGANRLAGLSEASAHEAEATCARAESRM